MITAVTAGCVGVLGVAHQVARLSSRAAFRRREARSLRAILLEEVAAGDRSYTDPAVRAVLAWADEVADPHPSRA